MENQTPKFLSPNFFIPSGLEKITSSDKAIGIQNVSKFPLSLNVSQIIVHRNTGDTVSFNVPVGIDLYRKMLKNERKNATDPRSQVRRQQQLSEPSKYYSKLHMLV